MFNMNKRGFSLIEVVLVILVVGVASLGLVVAMQQSLFDTPRPQVISTATALAAGEAERVIRLSFDSVLNQNRDAPASYTGNFAAYSWQVRVDSIDTAQPNLGSDPTMANYKVVEVRVHHTTIGYISIKFLRTRHTTY